MGVSFSALSNVTNASAKNLYKDIIIINNLLQIKMQCNWLSYCTNKSVTAALILQKYIYCK